MGRSLLALISVLGLCFLAPVAAKAEGSALTGVVGWYGTGWGECLGCRRDRLMANGQRLNDDDLTIACGKPGSCEVFPLGTRVRITNLSNGKTVTAIVTDTGGFASLNRIADCSKAVAAALDFDGLTKARIEVLPEVTPRGAMP